VKQRYLAFLVYLGLAALLFCAPASWSQSLVSGEVDGVVTDATGGVVPNATIALSNSSSGFSAGTTSNSSGEFRFALLKPGGYVLTVTAPGFSKASLSIVVSLGQAMTIPVKLEIGAKVESVENYRGSATAPY